MAEVNTVLCPVSPDDLGVTSMHEHILFGLPGWELAPEEHFDRAAAFEKIRSDLEEYRSLGGRTIVDCSGIALGRDVEFYSLLSKATGVNIVAATGFSEEIAIPGHFHFFYDRSRGVQHLERIFRDELRRGMAAKGMTRAAARAGLITVGNSWDKITRVEEMTYRAAAQAAGETGAAVMTQGVGQALRQMEILTGEGLDPGRIIIGHCDDARAIDRERDEEIARRGAYVAYDHVGYEPPSPDYALPDERRVELVVAMVAAGFVDRVILSSNAVGYPLGWEEPKHAFGHLLRSFVPMLRRAGIGEEAINIMLVENPKRLLPF
ncbi:MAG: phosphotriesterase [Dehalococcoidia bacterium]